MLKCSEEEAVDLEVDKVAAVLVEVVLVAGNNLNCQQLRQDFRVIAAELNGMVQELIH